LHSRAQALSELPALTPAIVAAATYYDAKITAPERLVFELIADGLEANPRSAAASYTTLQSQERGALTFADTEGRRTRVRPRILVNAAGPWIDEVNANLGHRSRLIGGTKGSHLLLRHDELVRSLGERMIYFEADNGRICLVYGYLGLALVGSTDIPADNPDDVRCDDDEIGYLLDSLSNLLPGFRFEKSQIIYAYSGIRPLPFSDETVPGMISRDHSSPTFEAEPSRPFPIVSLVGGKWTTFRGFAEEIADKLLVRLGRTRKISTKSLPIGGGRDFPCDASSRDRWLADSAEATGVGRERLATLLARYGTTASAVARHISAFVGERPLEHARNYSRAEIDFLARSEHVTRLGDIVLRRTAIAITGAVNREDLHEIASVAGDALGWSGGRQQDEVESTAAELARRHAYRFV